MTRGSGSASGTNNLRRRVRSHFARFLWSSLETATDSGSEVRCRVVITFNELSSRVIIGSLLDLFELFTLFGKELAKVFLCVKQMSQQPHERKRVSWNPPSCTRWREK